MKHFRKVCAVLLAALMVAVMLPSMGLFTPETAAAEVGVIENGNFSQTETLTHSSGGTWVHALYWDQYEWGASVKSGALDVSKDSSIANHIVASQVVAVNTNATYTLTFKVKGGKLNCTSTPCFTYKVLGGTKGDTCNTQLNAGTPNTGSSWTSNSVTITTGSNKYIAIQFIGTGTGSENSQLDDVSLTVVNAGDTDTHAKPSFVDFGNELNRPKSASNNVVTQPSFESTTNAPWNTSTFIKNNLSVANDPDAKDGSKVLLYNNPTTTESWHYFDLDLPAGGNYVLSAWVKSPFLSATNQATASIGIVDPDTNKFFMSGLANYKGHTSTPYLQIRSTATDNQWHLRSVTFFVGAAGTVKIGVYGKQSTLYIDDISVHLVSNGVTYTGDQTGTLSTTNNTSNMYCETAENLVEDCNMVGSVAESYWKQASGWNNGFMSFYDGTDTQGRVLKFNGTGASGKKIYHYIKWIDVEPNTKYTVSFDYRISAKGTGQLRFLDNNIDLPTAFYTLAFSSTTNDWTTKSFTFNSGNYNRIAIAFTDGTGTAYFDDFRVFKTLKEDGSPNGTDVEPEEQVFPELLPSHPDKYISRMEMNGGNLGLGFLFSLESTGVTRNYKFEADYTNGKVEAFLDGASYQLVGAGAVITNNPDVGQNVDSFTLENYDLSYIDDESTTADDNAMNGKVIRINAKYLFYNPENPEHFGYDANLGYAPEIYFAMRITNIPVGKEQTVIYARPYYVFMYGDREIVVYGDIAHESYTPQKDINDGWLEWD